MKRPSLPAFAALVATVVAYVFTLPVAGRRDGDFVHLWVGGKALLQGGGAGLYDPVLQRGLLDAAFPAGLPAELWAARNDLLGAFFYPPPAALFYAPLGALDLHRAGSLHAGLVLLAAGAVVGLLGRRTGLGPVGAGLLTLTLPSFFFGYVLGQNGVYTLLVLLLSVEAALRGRRLGVGLLLGLLFAKPSWALAVLPLPLFLPGPVRGALRVWAGMALGGALLGLLSLPFVGMGAWARFLGLSADLARLDRLPGYPLTLQYNLWSLPRRVFGLGDLADGIGLLLVLGVLALGLRAARRLDPLRALALGLCLATAWNPHVHHYDLFPPLLGLGLLLGDWGRVGRAGKAWRLGLLAFHHLAFLLGGELPLAALAPLLVALGLSAQGVGDVVGGAVGEGHDGEVEVDAGVRG